ncbi:MAG: type II toxin-antitoxin system RelE/ParE family toxin [Alphaproteobacteria bacterium]|nr:type II toxin-antitoxin system RelE/ParE family toxin [Alphaproteobacteria bacterium]
MKIVYLPSAARDIAWFRYYYRSVFPEGSKNARETMKAIQKLLAANPYVGHRSVAHPGVLEFHIRKTPFSLIYRVTETQIEVLRVWDTRQGGWGKG